MPRRVESVTVSEIVGCHVDTVWHRVLDIESYPRYMPDVRSVRVLEQDGERRTAQWEVLLRGAVLRWVEEGWIDARQRCIRFRQTEGDLSVFEGDWHVVGVGQDRTAVTLNARFEIGIPLLAGALGPVARESFDVSVRGMLVALGREWGQLRDEAQC
jgi:coenzyme Q-binding protein COQ10